MPLFKSDSLKILNCLYFFPLKVNTDASHQSKETRLNINNLLVE